MVTKVGVIALLAVLAAATAVQRDEPRIVIKISTGHPVVDEIRGTEPYVPVLLPGSTFTAGGGHANAEQQAARALGPNANKLNTNRTAINQAAHVAEEAKAELNHYRRRVWRDQLVHGNSLLESEATAEAETESEAEAESESEAEAEQEDLPPANPDMVPIPESVHDIITMEDNKPVAGFPDTPVYIVQGLGKAFVPQGETFTARVGPGGSQMADHILTRAADVPKLNKKYKPMMSALNHSNVMGEQLQIYRGIINQPFEDAKASPIVDADLKPVINYGLLEADAQAAADEEMDEEMDAEDDA